MRQLQREMKAREHAEEIAERELRRYHLKNEELKLALETKAEFCAMMSHELLSPLGAIVSALDAIRIGVFGDVETSAQRKVQFTLEQAEQMQTRMRTMMECLASSDVSDQLSVTEFDLAQLMDEVVARHSAFAAGKQIRLLFEETGPISIRSDALVVRRVIDALLHNAVKFTNSGQVTVRIRELWSGRSIAICIHDTGMGIEGRYVADIFEPFFQIDSGLDRQNEGMGLGLYLAKKLLKSLKGDIRVRWPIAGGSCFTSVIPRDVDGNEKGILPHLGYEESLFEKLTFSH